ncbi:hypothetical protein MASR1M65_10870 [Saprospiraceae bacterium]
MQTRLTTFSKILITALILGVIFFGFKYFLNNTNMGKDLKKNSENIDNSSGTSILRR